MRSPPRLWPHAGRGAGFGGRRGAGFRVRRGAGFRAGRGNLRSGRGTRPGAGRWASLQTWRGRWASLQTWRGRWRPGRTRLRPGWRLPTRAGLLHDADDEDHYKPNDPGQYEQRAGQGDARDAAHDAVAEREVAAARHV